MLTIMHPRSFRTCDGMTRRSFLRVGTFAWVGLTLAELLRLQAQAAPAGCPDPTAPWSSRSIGTGRARSAAASSIAVPWSAVSDTVSASLREREPSSA